MAITKSYTLIFTGPKAIEAQQIISTHFIDGGGEDMVLEEMSMKDIKATRTSWGINHMSFTVVDKTPSSIKPTN